MNEGSPIPEKPEEIEILYPSLEVRKKTHKEAPQMEASPSQTPPTGTCGQDTVQQDTPADGTPQGSKDSDTVPLEEAVAELYGPNDGERPPVPLEPEVVVINMPPPTVNLSKDRDIEANKAGRDVDEADGTDSDCQIVDENPKRPPSPKHQGQPHRDCGG